MLQVKQLAHGKHNCNLYFLRVKLTALLQNKIISTYVVRSMSSSFLQNKAT